VKNEFSVFGLFRSLRDWKNGNKCTAFEALVELDAAFSSRKECVIFALAYAFAWPPFIAALTRNDVAWDDRLSAKDFNAKTTTN
jgi:hypothetical protein